MLQTACSTDLVLKLLDILWKDSSGFQYPSIICSKCVLYLKSMMSYKEEKKSDQRRCPQSFTCGPFCLWYFDNMAKILDCYILNKCISNSLLWENDF